MAESYINEVREVISEYLEIPLNKISPGTDLAYDLMADSLDMVEIVSGIEVRFDIEIPDEKFYLFRTVKDISDYVDEAVSGGGDEKKEKFIEFAPLSDHLYDKIIAAVKNAFKKDVEITGFDISFEELGADENIFRDIQKYTEKYLRIVFMNGYVIDMQPVDIGDYIECLVSDICVGHFADSFDIETDDGIDLDREMFGGCDEDEIRRVFDDIGDIFGIDMSSVELFGDMSAVEAVNLVFDVLNESYGG